MQRRLITNHHSFGGNGRPWGCSVSAISWPTTVPSPTSAASSGDDAFRSLLTSFALGVSTSFVWPGSGSGSSASAGESVLGNARFAYAGVSATKGGVGDGFLLLNTDRVSLHHIGSTLSSIVAHSAMLTHSSVSGAASNQAPFDKYWLMQEDFVSNSLHTSVITFPTSYVSGAPAPVVILSEGDNAGAWGVNCVLQGSITTLGFTAVGSGTGFWWRALGQVQL